MRALIKHMMECGWQEIEFGKVFHPDVDAMFGSWEEAIIACITIASGC